MNNFFHNFEDMLLSGIIQCAQKLATQYGACDALTSFWKYAIGTYHKANTVFY